MTIVSCVIIGGGIAGLTAAFYAEQHGIDTLLLDPDLKGGVMESSRHDGFLCDDGPNVFLEKPALQELLTALELTDACCYSALNPYKQHVYYSGAPTEVPKTPVAFLKSPFFGFRDKCSLLGSVFGFQKQYPQRADCSVAELFTPLIGERAVYALLEPALQGIYGGRVESLSAQMIFEGLHEHLCTHGTLKGYARSGPKKNILVLKDGAASLPARLMERISADCLRQDRVVSLAQEGDLFQIGCASGDTIRAKSVVITTAGAATASYLAELDSDLSTALAALSFAPLVMMHLSVPRDCSLPDKSFGVLFPPGRPSGLLGVMCKSVLFPHVAPAGRHLLSICAGGAGTEALLSASDEELQEVLQDDIKETLGISDTRCLGMRRWERAIPQYAVGHREKLVAHMDAIEKSYEGLYFAGVDKKGVGVPDRIALARDIVKDRLKQFLER